MFASGLPVVGRILVWLIVLGGLGTFIWRRVQGIPMRDKPKTKSDDRGPLGVGEPPTQPLMPIFPPLDPAAGRPASPPVGPPPVMPSASASPPGPTPAAPPPAVPGAGGGAATSARSGFFAPAPDQLGPSPAEPPSTPATGRATVAEALQGIVMPCGLSPVVDGSTSLPNPFRVSFLTDLAPAPEVGRALADELERLGFALATATATELVARRDRTELRVVLYPTASSAKRGLEQLFPAAGPGAVGVELST